MKKHWLIGALAAGALVAVGCSNNGTGGSGDLAKDRQDVAQTEQDNARDMAKTQQDAQNKVADAQKDANHEIADQQKENQKDLANAQNDVNKDQAKANGQLAENGKALTSQAGVVSGRVTDISDKSFTVKVPNGDSVELQKAAQASKTLSKGEEVRATYRVDTDGNKVAQDVTVIRATTGDHANP
jgi:hypothetical protein